MFDNPVVERVKQATLAMQRYSWEQGVVAQAFLEMGEAETAILLAVEGANRQIGDGRCAQMGDPCAVTDPCAIGEALIFACEQTGDAALGQSLQRLLNWALTKAPRNAQGTLYHLDNSKQFWVDSFYMLPPFLARAGKYDEALVQMDGYWNALFLPEKSLLAHMWDDQAGRFLREDVWGVGNGWAAAGMARVIDLLPPEYAAQKQTLAERIQTLLDAALSHQRADGLFHDVLDKHETFVDTNAAQMLAYVMFRGVRSGYLEDRYLARAEAIYQAVLSKVDRYGLVREVCGAPHFDAPGVAPEGQAFFLLMEAARRKACR